MMFDAAPLCLPADMDSLIDEAVGALRISGRIVQKLVDPPDTYSIDNGSPVTFGDVVALAWDTGLISEAEGMQ